MDLFHIPTTQNCRSASFGGGCLSRGSLSADSPWYSSAPLPLPVFTILKHILVYVKSFLSV